MYVYIEPRDCNVTLIQHFNIQNKTLRFHQITYISRDRLVPFCSNVVLVVVAFPLQIKQFTLNMQLQCVLDSTNHRHKTTRFLFIHPVL